MREEEQSCKVAFVCAEDENPGVGCLSSFLKQRGQNVKLIFDPLQGNRAYLRLPGLAKALSWEKDNLREIKEYGPSLIGFSCVTAHYQWALNFAKKIKQQFPEVPIIFGGVHPTLVPEVVIKEESVDYVCVGEGEKLLIELLQALGGEGSLSDIQGLVYKDKGIVKFNSLRQLTSNLDELPFTDKALFYKVLPAHYRKSTYFFTSRGCPLTCSFCGNEQMKKTFKNCGRWVRQMSVPRAIAELEHIKSKFGTKFILFEDDVLMMNKKWFYEFIAEYKRKINLPFQCFGHPKFLDRELVKTLKESGCFLMWIGIQSVNEKIRREVFGRYETNEEILNCAALLKEYKIKFMVDHLLNYPYETDDAEKEAVSFYNQLRPTMINCYRLLYFPKSRIGEMALSAGLLKPEDFDNINSGKGVNYQTGLLSYAENDFYRRWGLVITAIPLMPKWFARRLLSKPRILSYFGRLPILFITIAKVILNFRLNGGFLPLAIVKMEFFFLYSFVRRRLSRLFA